MKRWFLHINRPVTWLKKQDFAFGFRTSVSLFYELRGDETARISSYLPKKSSILAFFHPDVASCTLLDPPPFTTAFAAWWSLHLGLLATLEWAKLTCTNVDPNVSVEKTCSVTRSSSNKNLRVPLLSWWWWWWWWWQLKDFSYSSRSLGFHDDPILTDLRIFFKWLKWKTTLRKAVWGHLPAIVSRRKRGRTLWRSFRHPSDEDKFKHGF